MPDKKETSRERVQKWRERLRARGGKEVRLRLEKEAVEELDRLKEHYDMGYGDIVSMGLSLLSMTKEVVKPEIVLKKKDKGEAKTADSNVTRKKRDSETE